jgi:creatinine amidohydrolase
MAPAAVQPLPTPARARVLEWSSLTGAALGALDPAKTIVLVACSPLEVHGPHLPVICDLAEADGLLAATAAKLAVGRPDLTFIRLPPIYVAADVMPQRGSLAFDPRTVYRVLVELGRSLARQGLRHVWVGNFHGGPRHVLAIEAACAEAHRRHGIDMLSVFSLMVRRLTGGSSDVSALLDGIGGIPGEELRGDVHGGLIETSMNLHLHGEHVDAGYRELPPRSVEIALAERGEAPLQAGAKATFREQLRGLFIRARYFDTETYAGAPAKATAELGAAYLDAFAREAAIALTQVLDGEVPRAEMVTPLYKLRHVLLNRAVGWVFDRVVRQRGAAV